MSIVLDNCFFSAYDKKTEHFSHKIPLENLNIDDMLLLFDEKTPEDLAGGEYDVLPPHAVYFSKKHGIVFDFEKYDYCFSAYQK
jgi:hypothetical protein